MVHGRILLTMASVTAWYIWCISICSCVLIHKYHVCRYACILPYGHILFSTIIHEFGKKGDLVSALTAYEASKQHLTGPNMYVYRTIIDVCGLCGDFMKSRYIYEVLSLTTYINWVNALFGLVFLFKDDINVFLFSISSYVAKLSFFFSWMIACGIVWKLTTEVF